MVNFFFQIDCICQFVIIDIRQEIFKTQGFTHSVFPVALSVIFLLVYAKCNFAPLCNNFISFFRLNELNVYDIGFVKFAVRFQGEIIIIVFVCFSRDGS